MRRRKMRGLFRIDKVRRFFMMPFRSKWNAWVRDITAKLEGTWLIRSKDVTTREALQDVEWPRHGFEGNPDDCAFLPPLPFKVKPLRKTPRVFVELDFGGLQEYPEDPDDPVHIPEWTCLYCNKTFDKSDTRILPHYPSCPHCKGHLQNISEFLEQIEF
jgi:hypothetical protein